MSTLDYGNYTLLNTSSSIHNASAFNNIGNTVSVLSVLRPQWVVKLLNGTETTDDRLFFEAYGWIKSVTATQCSLYFCVRRYNGTVEQGRFTETVVGITQNDTASSVNPFANGDMPTLHDVNFTIPVQNRSQSANYSVSGNALYGVSIAFITWWDGAVTGNIYAMAPGSNFERSPSDTINLLNSLNTTGIKRMIHSLADSMTNNIRMSSNEFVLGETTVSIPIVFVVWRWIALPGTLLFLALIFLLGTALSSSKDRTGLWKGSGLASFHSPLTKEGREQVQTIHGSRLMDEVAKDLRVKWMETEKGWRLVQV